jgi:hypothetical protein
LAFLARSLFAPIVCWYVNRNRIIETRIPSPVERYTSISIPSF